MNGHLFFITLVFFILYIVQGIPFGLQEKYIPIHYRNLGLQYSQFSLFQLVHLPLMSRILMAPFVDRIKQKHICVANCLLLTGSCYFFISLLNVDEHSTIRLTLMLSNILIAFLDVTLDVMLVSNLKMQELAYGNVVQLVGYKIGMIIGSGTFGLITQSWNLPFIFAAISIMQLCCALIAVLFFNLHDQLQQKPATHIPYPRNVEHSIKPPEFHPPPPPRIHRTQIRTTSSSPINAACSVNKENVRMRNAIVTAAPKERITHYIPLSDAYYDLRDLGTSKNSSHSEVTFSVADLLQRESTMWTLAYVFTYKLGELGLVIYFPIFLIDAGISPITVHWWNGIVCQIASIVGCIICSAILANKLDIYNNLWRFSLLRLAIMFLLLVLVLRTNEQIREDKNKWLFSVSVGLLTALSFISGAIKTTVFILMKVVSKNVPQNNQAFHYNILAMSELLGKLTMTIFWGPAIDLFGEDLAFTVYFLFNIAPILLLLRFPGELVNIDEV